MSVTRYESRNFIGMDISFKDIGTVKTLMQEYIKECIKVFNEGIKKANTPAKHNLFEVNDGKERSEATMEVSRHIVAKSLYVYKRARFDIDLSVDFLCTRVSRSTEED
eukprot:CAMPEP_0197824012 /NCGR_PEP_ID=MMETSP1437-20131217/1329_1 /TAXON_ID=49252 ORGANISM="Eucampia antarctica, Strain CCMP1452" /NCGR_SAMPLE_ID=MMETSP1437 /ASSEMBLY_ACC=CAM_ASM_001096 /LENGTH=107 /DNA_ID=CAMNT_0043423477 /DNA_START=345 /DNA_END=668 /DNA_ORIENTATION=-